jgi:cell wall-associated NlpC family hydrolase
MKSFVLIPSLLVTVPGAASAQLDVVLRTIGSRPEVRADLGPWSATATLGRTGIDLRVGERATAGRRAERSTRVPTRVPGGTGTASTRATAGAVLATAGRYEGTRYVWGGETPAGFDCSGFVQYVFRRHGVALPRTSRQQALVGQRVALGQHNLRPGDLMLFATRGGAIDHVAIFAGDNRIIHSSASGGGVGYDDLSSRRGRWFAASHVATRRVLADGRSLVGDLDAVLRMLTELEPPDRGPRR